MKKLLNIFLILLLMVWGSSAFAMRPQRTLDTSAMPVTTFPDDTALIFGTSSDFCLEYDSVNAYLQFGDCTNDFLRVTDDGTTATFAFLGDGSFTGKVGFGTTSPAGRHHVILSAGLPAIFGGDALATVTGVTGTDASPTVLTVATTNGVAEGDAVIINSGTNVTVGTYWVTAVVVNVSVTLDRNASSGGAISAASVTYVNDPIIIESGSGSGEPRIVLPVQNDAVTPTLGIGGTGEGFYAGGPNELDVAISGGLRFQFAAIQFTGMANADAFALGNVAATSTVPVYYFRSDSDTGEGRAAEDQLSHIAGGVEAQRLTEASRTIESNATVGE
ncbi:hypothetical protein LCGC14_2280190, partial [marine sediment metagenome]